MMRWQTFMMLKVQANLDECGIREPGDLLKFNWDDETESEEMSQEEANDLLDLIKRANEKNVVE